MNPSPDHALRSCVRLQALAQTCGAALAVAQLPAAELPWPWQLSLLLPGALTAAFRPAERYPFWRAIGATVVQVSACGLAFSVAGPISRPAALAGTILPPLAFVTVRRGIADSQLGVFLAFCVLLVGQILGNAPLWTLAPWLTAAILQLRCDSRLAFLRNTNAVVGLIRPQTPRLVLASGLQVAASCLVVALACQRLLAALPAPRTAAPTAMPSSRTGTSRTGLGDTFVLENGGNALDLRGERLVTVATTNGNAVQPDLYLRSGFFQTPGLDSWQVGTMQPNRHDASAVDYRVHAPLPGTRVQRLEITRLLGAKNRIFVPPGTCTILGVPDLFGDKAREWFRQQEGSHIDVYEVDFQDLPPPGDDLPVDSRWERAGLLSLPADLDRGMFAPLLAEFAPAGSAMAKADAIARGLQTRCRYELREPTGPHEHALLNFLHGDRVGFCMHFASAAAILLRMSGVPCRLGVGLYGGARRNNGEREYGAQHSHAWVEIPILGRGWVTFDPTPPASRGARPTPETANSDGGATAAATTPDAITDLLGWFQRSLQSVWLWLGLLLLLLVPWRRGRTNAVAAAMPPTVKTARRWLARILRSLAERGHHRGRSTTLEQFAAALTRVGACPAPLRSAFATYQEVRFGARPWDAAREAAMAAGLAAADAVPSVIDPVAVSERGNRPRA